MGLLKGIDPLLTADLLWVLRSMGHGDQLCIVDCNFPAYEVSRHTTAQKLVIMSNATLPEATRAVVSVLPLDFFVDHPALIMAPSQGLALPEEGQSVRKDTQRVINQHASNVQFHPIERFDFYEQARKCFAVVQTSERRPYGNVILQKGVIGPDGMDLKP